MSWKVVVLRTRDFSYGKIAVAGALGNSGNFPRPDLGTRCVCCDANDVSVRHFDPSTDRFRCDPIDLPLCESCVEHVSLSTHAQQLVGALICVGGGGILYALGTQMYGWAALAAVLIAVLAAWGLRRLSQRESFARRGHHTGLEIGATIHQCVIRTTNPRLAAEVAERNRELVHRVR